MNRVLSPSQFKRDYPDAYQMFFETTPKLRQGNFKFDLNTYKELARHGRSA